DAVDVGQPEVEDDDVGVVDHRPGQPGRSLGGRNDLVAPGPQPGAEHFEDGHLVVDDQDPGHEPASVLAAGVSLSSGSADPVAAGSRRAKVAPPPGVPVTAMRPPWASTIPLTMARPIPVPNGPPPARSR